MAKFSSSRPSKIEPAVLTASSASLQKQNLTTTRECLIMMVNLQPHLRMVQPNLAADPGLVYDTNVDDYLNFLCAGGCNKTLLNAFSDGPDTCPENFKFR
ncbi:PROPROTEIN CONVERTASE SUBTILISIN/KEXIN [Salix purpurea]|uniref:PROPROTEIN CONVERTASE SUBTILISIN/KEXIN n=1 Tax=Salix purpurea TaxID=77065 RepID=A0A9Q1A017_SALPP|nr:PROPROTEIN CONVERTASE SUBTILISIN/KEXIN [Salix purpurea]